MGSPQKLLELVRPALRGCSPSPLAGGPVELDRDQMHLLRLLPFMTGSKVRVVLAQGDAGIAMLPDGVSDIDVLLERDRAQVEGVPAGARLELWACSSHDAYLPPDDPRGATPLDAASRYLVQGIRTDTGWLIEAAYPACEGTAILAALAFLAGAVAAGVELEEMAFRFADEVGASWDVGPRRAAIEVARAERAHHEEEYARFLAEFQRRFAEESAVPRGAELFTSSIGRYFETDLAAVPAQDAEIVTAMVGTYFDDVNPWDDSISHEEVLARTDVEMTERSMPPMLDFTMELYPPQAAVRMYGPGPHGCFGSMLVVTSPPVYAWAYTTVLEDGRWIRTTSTPSEEGQPPTASVRSLPDASSAELFAAHLEHVAEAGVPALPAPGTPRAMLETIDRYLQEEVALRG